MSRIFGICSAWSLLALGIAHAVPARPLYEPEPPPKLVTPVVLNLAGTAWLGKYGVANRTFVFEADGSISYSSTGKTLFRQRGSWKFDGTKLYFDHHIGVAGKKTLEFRGVLKDQNTIVGEQTMVNTGVKSNVTMQKTTLPGK